MTDAHAAWERVPVDRKKEVLTLATHALREKLTIMCPGCGGLEVLRRLAHTCNGDCDVREAVIHYQGVLLGGAVKACLLSNGLPSFANQNWFRVPDTYICTISGKVHVCTESECEFFALSEDTGEDGCIACPMTGIVHSRADCFAKSWQRESKERGAFESVQYSLLRGRHEISKGATQQRARAARMHKTISSALGLIEALLPHGKVHKRVQSQTMQRLAETLLDTCFRHTRKARRLASCSTKLGKNSSGVINIARLRADVNKTLALFESRNKLWRCMQLEPHQCSSIARYYASAYANLWMNLANNAKKNISNFKGPTLERFVLGMLYLSQNDLVVQKRMLIQGDQFLAVALPPLPDIIRARVKHDPAFSWTRLRLSNTTKFIHEAKNLVSFMYTNNSAFSVNFTEALTGNTELLLS